MGTLVEKEELSQRRQAKKNKENNNQDHFLSKIIEMTREVLMRVLKNKNDKNIEFTQNQFDQLQLLQRDMILVANTTALILQGGLHGCPMDFREDVILLGVA